MATRAFVVFRDVPSEPLPTIKTDVSPSPPLIEPTVFTVPVTAAEKENLHPVTGARSNAATDSQSKKRKNGILATKFYIPPTTKKSRDSDSRKRETTRSSTKTFNGSRATSLGAPNLSEVEESAEPEQPCQDKVEQAEVDSKCYDLTVSPLADVSQAFDQVSPSSAESRPGISRILSPKKQSCSEDNEISSLKPLAGSVSPKTVDTASEEALFSTPERKQIYAAFTFTTPSPSSKLRVASHSHLDIFGDIKFDP